MTDFLKLAAGLSAYNAGQYDGYAIGRARWQLEGQIHTVECRIQTEKKGYAVIDVKGFDKVHDMAGWLSVTLMKNDVSFHQGKRVKGHFHTKEQKEQFCFTQVQVEYYLKHVQDTNPIHRGDRAVVPGLMLIDFILKKGMVPLGRRRCTMRFKTPMFIGSYFTCFTQDRRISIESPEEEICYAEVSYY